MDNRPIGVFDSGLGGLTAVRRLRQILPDENIIYFGDTGRMPYGGRPREQMRTIARQNITFAESFDVKVILAACGTISSNAPDIIAANATKTIGVLLPGAERLAATGRKELGVIATKTSIESGAFQLSISRFAPDAKITAAACPDFVPMIESGHYLPDDPMVQRIVAQSLEPLKDVGALLLGCTHYGLIADAICEYLGKTSSLSGRRTLLRKRRCVICATATCSHPAAAARAITQAAARPILRLWLPLCSATGLKAP